MNQEQFEEMAAAYCLGVLSDDERMTFERALAAASPQQREVFEQMRTAARHIPASTELANPTPEARQRILDAIGAPSSAPQATFEVTDTSIEPVAKPGIDFSAISSAASQFFSKIKNFKKIKFDSKSTDHEKSTKLDKTYKIEDPLVEKIYRKMRFDQPKVAVTILVVLFFAAVFFFFEQAGLKSSISDYEQQLALQSENFKSQTIEFSDTKNKLAALETQIQTQSTQIAELEKKSTETTDLIAAKDKELNDIKTSNAQNQEIMAVLQSPDLRTTDLKGLKPYPQGRAKVMFSPKSKLAYIHIINMPPAPATKDYQLWIMEGNKPVSAGILEVRAGSFIFKVPAGLTVSAQRISAFAITLEPKGGLLKPSGPTYMMGNVRL